MRCIFSVIEKTGELRKRRCDVLSEGISNNYFSHPNNVLVIRRHQCLNLSQTRDREPVLLLVHLEFLERDDISSRFASRSKDNPVTALLNLIQSLRSIARQLLSSTRSEGRG